MDYLDFDPVSNSSDIKLELGKILVERFIGKDALDFAPGMDPYQTQATNWLKAIGFDRVEWMINDDGDILMCLLWGTGNDGMVEFAFEFAGYDAQIISVLEVTKSVEL